ncbi:hypothetical protein EG329_008519 [Mollisiaceae sp. DMI_Dod_QoI]|nr:hypothetical protein EG329_008519 [Helotiales sp. DMI_Dod_QoI]
MITYPPYNGPQADAINAVALPFFALLGIFVTYLPLRSFWAHSNVPTVSIVIATNIINLITFLNAIIWSNDDWASWWPGYGLCDVEALLRYPITIALASSLCGLSKGLADCLDTDNARVHQTAAMRRRKLVLDILFCWGIPVLQMALHYVIQAGRFQIYPVFGCSDVIDNSWPTIVIIMIWCPIFTFVNMYYAVLLLIRLRKHRRTISSALTTTGSGFAARKYLKLIIITLSLIVIYLPTQLLFFFEQLPTQLVSYSWSRIHDPISWNPIEYLHTGDASSVQYHSWSGVATAFLLFVYFGFNDDAVDTYRSWMVVFGFAHIWPSLKHSREMRREMDRRGSSSTRVSLSSSLDIVGKVMKYFDEDARKGSTGGTTMVDRNSEGTTSRKGLHGTLTGLTRIPTGPDNLRKKATSPDSSTVPSSYMSDIISPAPPIFAEPVYPIEPLQLSEPDVPTSHRRNFFPTFRTHLNVPFPFFGHRSATSSQVHTGTQTQVQDLEAQNLSAYPTRTSSMPRVSHQHHCANQHLEQPVPMSIDEVDDEDIDIDPHAPKMGTRAYREREKREMQRLKEEESEQEKKEQKASKIIADNMNIEKGMEVLGWNAKPTPKEEKNEGVRVVKSFEILKENAVGPS